MSDIKSLGGLIVIMFASGFMMVGMFYLAYLLGLPLSECG